jgi:tetratricopeptide (TPR) repeat protein
MPLRTCKKSSLRGGNEVKDKATPLQQRPRQREQHSAQRPPLSPLTKNGNDTSGTYSDSSFEADGALFPMTNIDMDRLRHATQKSEDVSSIHFGESVTHGITSTGAMLMNGGVPQQNSTRRSSQELDNILLLDTIALANDDNDNNCKNKKGSHKMGKLQKNGYKKNKQSKGISSKKHINSQLQQQQEYNYLNELTRDMKVPIDEHCSASFCEGSSGAAADGSAADSRSFASNATLASSGALSGSDVGLSLMSKRLPLLDDNEWTNPPSPMIRESIARHMQLCLAHHPQCVANNKNTKSLPINVDDVSFVKTNPDNVGQVAMEYVSDGEHGKALEIYRVLLRNQQKQYISDLNESEIAETQSNLSVLCLLLGRTQEAMKYSQASLKAHKAASRPVQVTLSTMELGLVLFGAQQLSKALQAWREAFQLACMTLGYDHFTVAVLLNNIGCLHFYMGNLASSIRALEESLGLQRQILSSTSHTVGVEFPLLRIATTMGNLAIISAECKNYDTAINMLEEALALQESTVTTPTMAADDDNDHDDDGNELQASRNSCTITEHYLERLEAYQANQVADQQIHISDGETKQNGTPAIRTTDHTMSSKESASTSTNSSSTMNSVLQPTISIFGDADGIPIRRTGTCKRNPSCCSHLSSGGDDHNFDFILLGSLVKPCTSRQRIHRTILNSLETVAKHQNTRNMADDASTLAKDNRKKRSIPVDLDGEQVIDAELHLEEIHLQALDHLFVSFWMSRWTLFTMALSLD